MNKILKKSIIDLLTKDCSEAVFIEEPQSYKQEEESVVSRDNIVTFFDDYTADEIAEKILLLINKEKKGE